MGSGGKPGGHFHGDGATAARFRSETLLRAGDGGRAQAALSGTVGPAVKSGVRPLPPPRQRRRERAPPGHPAEEPGKFCAAEPPPAHAPLGGCLAAVPPRRLPRSAAMAPARRRGASRGRPPPAGRALAAAGGRAAPGRRASSSGRQWPPRPRSLPARHACLRPPLAEHGAGEGRGEPPPCHSLSQLPPHRRSPVSDGHGAAPQLAAPGGLRAPRTSRPTGKRRGEWGWVWSGSALSPELQPARRRHLSSGVEGLRSARSCRLCLGARGDAPLPSAARGREGAAGVGGFFPARNGLSASRTEQAGVPAAAALRAAATHPLLSALGPKYFSAAVACPAGRDPGSALLHRGLPPGCAPRAAPDPASCPPLPLFSQELGFP